MSNIVKQTGALMAEKDWALKEGMLLPWTYFSLIGEPLTPKMKITLTNGFVHDIKTNHREINTLCRQVWLDNGADKNMMRVHDYPKTPRCFYSSEFWRTHFSEIQDRLLHKPRGK